MAIIHRSCSTCGGTSSVAFGQHLVGGELRWSGQETCTSCDAIVEFDDFGDVPEELKPALLQDKGEWQLIVGPKQNRVAAMKVIRERLQFSIAEAKSAIENLRGTKTTLEWLQQGLNDVGVDSLLSQVL